MTLKVICFEGIDGSGKTTIIREFVKFLNSININVIQSREPGGTPEAEYLRDTLKQQGRCVQHKWSPNEQMLLMFTARMQSSRELEKYAIENNATVLILDRNYLSSYVYQVIGQGACSSMYRNLLGNYIADGGLIPHQTIILHNENEEELATQISNREGDLDCLDQLAISKRAVLEKAYLSFNTSPTNGIVTHVKTNPKEYQNLFAEFKKTDVFKNIIKSLV